MPISREDLLLCLDVERELLSRHNSPQNLARLQILTQVHGYLTQQSQVTGIDQSAVRILTDDEGAFDHEAVFEGISVTISRRAVEASRQLIQSANRQGVAFVPVMTSYAQAKPLDAEVDILDRENLAMVVDALQHRCLALLEKKRNPDLVALAAQLEQAQESLRPAVSVRTDTARNMRAMVNAGTELIKKSERSFAEQRSDSPPMDAAQAASSGRISERIQEDTRAALDFVSSMAERDVQQRLAARPARQRQEDEPVSLPLTGGTHGGAFRFLLPAIPGSLAAGAGGWLTLQTVPTAPLGLVLVGDGLLAGVAFAVANQVLRLHLRARERKAAQRMSATLQTSEVLIDRAVHLLDAAPPSPAETSTSAQQIQEWIDRLPAPAGEQLQGLLDDAEPLLSYGGVQFLAGSNRVEWDDLIGELLPTSVQGYLRLRSITGRSPQIAQDSLLTQLRMIRSTARRLTEVATQSATAELQAHESFLAQKLGHSDLNVD